MNPIGIVFSSVDGQTRKICEKLASIIRQEGIEVDLCSIDQFQKHLSDYEIFVIGSSIRYGKHHPLIENFVVNHTDQLNKINTAFFSVNLVARKNDKNSPDTNPYMQKFIKSIHWSPNLLEVFAGRLDYSIYSFTDKLMIKLIMLFTNGPTSTEHPIEYTDWQRVEKFAGEILQLGKRTNPDSTE
ncbi:menaquinone-dependent protoporphyrinogen oxidase [Zhouia amylolytica]|uniref:Protoporphyrinogen IX dehydrogenase [quinone] n=2 Tax=Zhouia amylolytica TaxID=376730 RepID=W2UT04_9FLAO|nr:menaquinone-dependent protoporphyrinogen IX dehydrogenase [Zhouia amylolytica]ETN96626.1 protoporphyrinogen oxidase [Zhouia amylolytica AD3]MCQ0112573.1 menaquinone-dependent protoporphyrinogen IX dehydrogenase [Zhouia amylolytica]SFS92670.1 menaquinone-dependent protoporphyrinogen oxidase [Zhouia amylolytica]